MGRSNTSPRNVPSSMETPDQNAKDGWPKASLYVCPGCGQSVDPLRAGHVAILEGGFHYFCHHACKKQYLRALGRSQEDVVTAPPPAVVVDNGDNQVVSRSMHSFVSSASPPTSASSGSMPAFPSPTSMPAFARSPSTSPSTSSRTPRASSPRSMRVPSLARRRPELQKAVEPIPPAVVPDIAPSIERLAPSPARSTSRADRALAIIDGLGIGAGVLAPAIGLLGSVAEAVRVPFVVVSWIALAVRMDRAARDPADPSPYVVLAPSGAAVLAACWAQAVSDPHAAAIAVLAGLGCAAAIAVEAMLARARVRVSLARAYVEQAVETQVRAVHGEETIAMAASDVRPGEQIVVEAGEIVGVDGVVTAGEARVIPWLGASIEVVKREGDPVVAGSRVVSSRLRMTTTWSGPERAWIKLLSVPSLRIDVASPTARVLRHTIERGVPAAALIVGIATFATNATAVDVVAAMSAAAMAFGAKALVSLVALHFARAHLEALQSGITYKEPRAFERAGAANIAVLCARGTVLLGEPEIVAIELIASANAQAETTSEQDDAARVLSLAAGAETASTHPFAAAILRAARTRGVRPEPVRNATAHAGLGVTALASNGERLVVGGRAIMLSETIGVAVADARVTELESQGRSVLLVALAERLVGLIALQDGLRAGARAAVQRLLDARIEPVLLSGEARDTCETIGRAVDIEHVRPAVLPADRGPEVRALADGGNVVAVVGQPVSDDGALGAADVAVAVDAAGSTPGEWAIALASDDVRHAALALSIPHATRARIRVAIALGATPGVVALLAIAFGVAPLAVAPLAVLVAAVAAVIHARESAS